jgi:hypothetical protein
MAQCAALAVEEAPAAIRSSAAVLAVVRGGRSASTDAGASSFQRRTPSHPQGFLAGLPVAAMPTGNSCSLRAPTAPSVGNFTARLPRNFTVAGRNVSARRPLARHRQGHTRTRCRLRWKTPSAAHR